MLAQKIVYAPHIRASKIQTVWRRTRRHKKDSKHSGPQAGHVATVVTNEQVGGGETDRRKTVKEQQRLTSPSSAYADEAVAKPAHAALSVKPNNSNRMSIAGAVSGVGANITPRNLLSPKGNTGAGDAMAGKPSVVTTDPHCLLGPLRSPNESLKPSKNELASLHQTVVDPNESWRSNEQAWR